MRTIQSMRRNHGDAYSFHPDGYVLPGDADQFERVVSLNFFIQFLNNNNDDNDNRLKELHPRNQLYGL